MIEHTIKLPEEKFTVSVPSLEPPHGYALLVFVPPWEDGHLPPGWAPVLERYGFIFVSAARSGNAAGVLDRREPLALIAAHNIVHRYPVDPGRVYVAGFSGGAGVALRLALGYPDLFHGAILNAGSDSNGTPQVPLPPKDLWTRFQNSSHLVYVTVEGDKSQLGLDQASMHSMRQWCVFDVQDHVEPAAGHEVAGPTAFAWAFNVLLHDSPPDRKKLAECRSAVELDLDSQLRLLESKLAGGDDGAARKLLTTIDGRYGGLAVPRSVELKTAVSSSPP